MQADELTLPAEIYCWGFNSDLIRDFYFFAKENNAPIHIDSTEKNFHQFLEAKAVEAKEDDVFKGIDRIVLNYINKSAPFLKKAYKKEIQEIGKENFED